MSFHVAAKESVGVVGRNGVGKTTLVESIFRMGPTTRGAMQFQGRRLDGMAASRLMGLGIALVPQGRRLFPSLTVGEHLALAAKRTKLPTDLDRIHALFPILEERSRAPAISLSGGERSMLAIARALVTSPRMVIMDEPTEGLAPLLVRKISETLLGLREEGVALLVVEQNLDLAIGVTDRLFVMDRGTIVEEFTSRAITDIEEVRRLIVLGRA
jgi:branched-chain amino acid transport system ATP-binding protein